MQHPSRPCTDAGLQKLYRLLAELRTPEEIAALLEDLCTVRELEQMAMRTECAEYLLRGETYQEIMGVKRPFDEKVVVAELLAEMRD